MFDENISAYVLMNPGLFETYKSSAFWNPSVIFMLLSIPNQQGILSTNSMIKIKKNEFFITCLFIIQKKK